MKLKTRVFELCKGKYKNPNQLALAMKIAPSQVYRVWHGERKTIGEKFILGAVRAFPGYSLDDLFYIEDGNGENKGYYPRDARGRQGTTKP